MPVIFSKKYEPLNIGQTEYNSKPVYFAGYKSPLKKIAKHCAYCGKELLSSDEVQLLSKNLSQKTGQALAGELSALTRKLPDKESAMVIRIIDIAKKSPYSSFNQLVEQLFKENRQIRQKDKNSTKNFFDNIVRHLSVTVDHIKPKWQKGSRIILNTLPSCYSCNSERGGMDFYKWVLLKPDTRINIEKCLKELNYQLNDGIEYSIKVCRTIYEVTMHKIDIHI